MRDSLRRIEIADLTGTIDPIIKTEVTQDYAAKLCKAGSKIETLALPNVGHGWAAHAAAPYAVDWMTAVRRRAGTGRLREVGAKRL